MTEQERKIKEFFSDEEKIKELRNDEDFMEKISGGQATAEVYAKKLAEHGLTIELNEAKIVKQTVQKAFALPVETLDDEHLSDVSGGSGAGVIAAIITSPFVVSSLGCSIASCVYTKKAEKANKENDKTVYEYYIQKSKACGAAAASLIGVSLGFNILSGVLAH